MSLYRTRSCFSEENASDAKQARPRMSPTPTIANHGLRGCQTTMRSSEDDGKREIHGKSSPEGHLRQAFARLRLHLPSGLACLVNQD